MYKIITPVITIFDSKGNIDIEGNQKVIDFLLSKGVDGILVLGSTGEFTKLSFEEKVKLFKIYYDKVQGQVELYAGTGCLTIEETISLTNEVSKIGYEKVMVIGPYYYGISQEELYRYYDTLAKSVHAKIYLYNFPERTGHSFSANTVKELVKNNKNIVGLKDSVTEPGHFNEISIALKEYEFEIFSGFDDQFVYNVSCGGIGGIGALSNIVPEIWRTLVDACIEKNYELTINMSRIINNLMPIYSLGSNVALILKELLIYRGLDISNYSLFPFNEISEVEREKGIKLLEEALEAYNEII